MTFKQDHVSIIAKQSSGILNAFQTEAGDVLEMLYDGIKTAKVRFYCLLIVEICFHLCGQYF